MSNTGGFWNGQPALTMYAVLLKPAPRDREAFIEHARRDVHQDRRLGLRARRRGPARRSRRSATTAGTTRAARSASCAAIVADRDRAPALRRLTVPATVIHGAEDKLVRPSGGRATAKAIPGARLVEIHGMGHGLPRGAWPRSSARSPTPPAAPARRSLPQHEDEHDDTISSRIDAAADRRALPLTRPVARVRLRSRVWRPSGGSPTQSSSSATRTSSLPISSTIVGVAVHEVLEVDAARRPPPRTPPAAPLACSTVPAIQVSAVGLLARPAPSARPRARS